MQSATNHRLENIYNATSRQPQAKKHPVMKLTANHRLGNIYNVSNPQSREHIVMQLTANHRLENIKPWCISRQLWWGHRIPAYFVEIEGEPKKPETDDDQWVVGRSQEEACGDFFEIRWCLVGVWVMYWLEA